MHGLRRALLFEPGRQGTQHASILTSFWKAKEMVIQFCFAFPASPDVLNLHLSEKETNGFVKGCPVTISPTGHAAAQFGLRDISAA